jgi:hypothetical protein
MMKLFIVALATIVLIRRRRCHRRRDSGDGDLHTNTPKLPSLLALCHLEELEPGYALLPLRLSNSTSKSSTNRVACNLRELSSYVLPELCHTNSPIEILEW